MLSSPRDILDLWPTLEAVAADFKVAGLSISSTMISKWAQRGRIPPEYWLPLVTIAAARGVEGVSLDVLAVMHARTPVDREPAEARA